MARYAGAGGVQALVAQRLTRPMPSLREQRPELTASLEATLGRALGARATERWRSATEFAAALRRVAGDNALDAQVISLVVRPFDTVGGDPELECFADGLTEEAIGDLSKVRALPVISRTSAMRLKGTGKDVRRIGGGSGCGVW